MRVFLLTNFLPAEGNFFLGVFSSADAAKNSPKLAELLTKHSQTVTWQAVDDGYRGVANSYGEEFYIEGFDVES